MGCDNLSQSESGKVIDQTFDREQLAKDDVYLIGTGIYDMTGPAAEVTMGGYAVDDQQTAGISLRLRSRAYIMGDNNNRVVFVSADTWAMCQSVKQKISQMLADDPILSKYYSGDNVCISATHTHNSVAGFSHYFLYNVPNKGFIEDSFNAVVDGIYNSIVRAHNNLKPGKIYVNRGDVEKCGANRAEFAYNNNPAEERALYKSNVDKSMTLLKFVTLEGEEIGMLNWYALHTDSIGPENKLLSGDNKGHASYMFEKDMGTDYLAERTFVAAFGQANSGDNTPNVPFTQHFGTCLLYTSPSPRDVEESRMPSSA